MAQNISERVPIGMIDPKRRVLVSDVHKDYVTIEKYSRETGGEVTRFVGGVKPGGGNPLHYHTHLTPTFTNIGETTPLHLTIASQTHLLAPGESITIPPGTVHRFFLPSTADSDCTFTVELRPGNETYEQFLTIMFGLANEGLCDGEGAPREVGSLAKVLVMGDMWVPGVVGWVVNAVFRGVSWWGGKEGEGRLLEKYWFN